MTTRLTPCSCRELSKPACLVAVRRMGRPKQECQRAPNLNLKHNAPWADEAPCTVSTCQGWNQPLATASSGAAVWGEIGPTIPETAQLRHVMRRGKHDSESPNPNRVPTGLIIQWGTIIAITACIVHVYL